MQRRDQIFYYLGNFSRYRLHFHSRCKNGVRESLGSHDSRPAIMWVVRSGESRCEWVLSCFRRNLRTALRPPPLFNDGRWMTTVDQRWNVFKKKKTQAQPEWFIIVIIPPPKKETTKNCLFLHRESDVFIIVTCWPKSSILINTRSAD